MAVDDTIDFSFDVVGKGRMKEFDFNKLDADYDKLSLFKVDVPDLDFSLPSKKSSNNED